MIAGSNGRMYIAQYDLSGYTNRFEPAVNRELIDRTTFTSGGRQWHPALHDDSFGFDAFYTSDVSAILTALGTATSPAVGSLAIGATQGSKAISGEGVWLEEYPLEASVDGLLRYTGTFRFHGACTFGQVLQTKATVSDSDASAGIDNGAATANGCEAFLHVFACDPADLVVKVEMADNADFTGATDLITFTTASGATSERVTATGSVERYVRASYAATWAGGEATIAVIFARL